MTLTNSFEKLFGRTKEKNWPTRYFEDEVIKKKESGLTIRKKTKTMRSMEWNRKLRNKPKLKVAICSIKEVAL